MIRIIDSIKGLFYVSKGHPLYESGEDEGTYKQRKAKADLEKRKSEENIEALKAKQRKKPGFNKQKFR